MCFHRRLVCSVGNVPVCGAGVSGFKYRQGRGKNMLVVLNTFSLQMIASLGGDVKPFLLSSLPRGR